MTEESAGTVSSKTAQATQQRFEFYLVALTFTLLGLAVQTGMPGVLPFAITEVAGWVLFLVSGLVGLRRLEWMPEIYRLHGLHSEQEERAQALKRAALQGAQTIQVLKDRSARPIDEIIGNAERSAQLVDDRVGELNRKVSLQYYVQRGAFVVGLALVVIARAAQLLIESAA